MTELTPEVLAKIRDILSPDKAQTKRATHVSSVVDRVYYYVEYKGFGTVVSSLDVKDAVEAPHFALQFEKLQPWYRLHGFERRSFDEEKILVQTWTHNDFCDWLRRRE